MTEELKKIIEQEASEAYPYVTEHEVKKELVNLTNYLVDISRYNLIKGITSAHNNPEKYGLPHWVKVEDKIPNKSRGYCLRTKKGDSYEYGTGWFDKGYEELFQNNHRFQEWLCEQPETSTQATELENEIYEWKKKYEALNNEVVYLNKEIERLKELLESQTKLLSVYEGDKSESAKEEAWQQFKTENNL